MKKYTHYDLRNDFELWQQYVDPQSGATKEDFDSMTEEEKIAVQTKVLGVESFNYWAPGLKKFMLAEQEEEEGQEESGK